jgi:POT family proton-dependent oligopeptide transporter
MDSLTSGGLGFQDKKAAEGIIGTFLMATYVTSIAGGRLGDGILSPTWMNRIGMLLMAVGHFILTIPTMTAAYLGLASIAVGAGAFKPNIYAELNKLNPGHEDKNTSILYIAINLGNLLGFLILPIIAFDSLVKKLVAYATPTVSPWRFAFGFTGLMIACGVVIHMLGSSNSGDRSLNKNVEKRRPVSSEFVVASFIAGVTLALLPETLVIPVALAIIGGGLFWVTRNRTTVVVPMRVLAVLLLTLLIFFAYHQTPLLVADLLNNYVTNNALLRHPLWISCLSPLFSLLALGPVNTLLQKFEVTQKLAIGVLAVAASFSMIMAGLLLALLSEKMSINPLWIASYLLLQAVAEVCIYNTCIETISRIVPQHQLSTAFGLAFFSIGCGAKISGIVSGWVSNSFSWKAIYMFAGHVMTLIVAAIVLNLITSRVTMVLKGLENSRGRT